MNDFTKEELESIRICLDKIEPFSYVKDFGALYIKIQSMIDNYCEHESLFSEGDIKHCCKCGKKYEI